MTEPRKRSPAEVWRALETLGDPEDDEADATDDATEAEMERILALSEADLERELVEAGFDVHEVRARGEAIGELATRGAAGETAAEPRSPQSPVVPLKRRPSSAWAVGLLAAALLGLAALFVWNARIPDVAHAPPAPSATDAPPRVHADWEREAGRLACDAARWRDCIAHLDAAKALDPAGDAAPTVQAERTRAAAALAAP